MLSAKYVQMVRERKKNLTTLICLPVYNTSLTIFTEKYTEVLKQMCIKKTPKRGCFCYFIESKCG